MAAESNHSERGIIVLAMVLLSILVLALAVLVVLYLRSERFPLSEYRNETTTQKNVEVLQGRERSIARGLHLTPGPLLGGASPVAEE